MAPSTKKSIHKTAYPKFVVLPHQSKKSTTFPKFVIPETQEEKQPWFPMHLKTDPERELRLLLEQQNSMRKLENSEFHHFFFDLMQSPEMLDRFMKILGSENQMKMVIYGIGSIERQEYSRTQLSLAILMKRKFNWIGEMEVYDPIISLAESRVLTSLGCTVLTVNERGRRLALKPTMFFMPHCDVFLYENLLETNWSVDRLKNLTILGNSFSNYMSLTKVFQHPRHIESIKHVLTAGHLTEEFKVDTSSDASFRPFNDTSWQFCSPSSEADLHLSVLT